MPRQIKKLYLCGMKIVMTIFGTLFLVLGIVGIFVPVLPTTPFLLLAAALYFRSSPRLYDWLMKHKRLGPYIRNFREFRAIPLRVKIISVSLVWLTLLYSSFFIVTAWWLRILLLVLAAILTWHILSYKTLRKHSR